MALYANSPTFKWISITGAIVVKDNKAYPLSTFKTNQKYVYWDISNPYELYASEYSFDAKVGRYCVLINKQGMPDIVPNDDIRINFDSNMVSSGSGGSGGSVDLSGVYEKIEELDGSVTERFAGVQTDISGILTRVSKTETDLEGVKTDVANVWQRADEIGSSVTNVDKKLDTTNEELNKFKGNVAQDFIDISTSLGDFSDYVNGAFKDDVIDESEAKGLEEHIRNIDREKVDLDNRAKYLLDNPAVVGTARDQLVAAKNGYNEAHDNLKNVINTVIADKKILPSERTLVTSAFATYSFKLTDLNGAIQRITDLGVVDKIETAKSEVIQTATELTSTVSKKVDTLEGNVNEELSQIKQTSNSITSRVEYIEKDYSTKADMEAYINAAKEEILEQVTDMDGIIDMVEDYINNTFGDKLLDEAFIQKLNDLIVSLDLEKKDIDNQVGLRVNNEYLDLDLKTFLSNLKTTYDTKHGILKAIIDNIVADESISGEEKNQLDFAISEYSIAFSDIKKHLDLCIDNISTNKMNNAIQETDKQIDEVIGSLGDLGDYINGAFKDDMLDESERVGLRVKLDNLEVEKADIDNQVDEILKNVNLIDPTRTDLVETKTSYDYLHFELITFIDNLLDIEGLIMDSDLMLLNNLFGRYVLALGETKKYIQVAIQQINTKTVENAKNDLENQIGDVDNALGNLNDYLEEGFKNGILTDAEILVIKNHLIQLDIEKKDVDYRYNLIIANSGIGDFKVTLETSKTEFDTAHANLIYIINNMVSDGNLTSNEKTQFENALSVYSDKLKVLSGNLQKAMELIPDYLIRLAKQELRDDIKDVSDALGGLEENIEGAFKDGILDEIEITSLKDIVKIIETEIHDITGRYEALMDNADLVSEEKNRLESTYLACMTSFNNLKKKINECVEKKAITPEDRLELDNLLNDYRLKLKTLGSVFERCVDFIAKKKVEDLGGVMESKFAEVKITTDSITSRVSATETVTETINGQITNLDTRISTAESKITDEAITNTVSKNFYTKDDVDGKGFQTESQVQQTVDKFEVKFTESGGYNRIRNAFFKNKWTNWDEWGVATRTIETRPSGDNYVLIVTTGQNQGIAQQITGLTPEKKYTLSSEIEFDNGVVGGLQIKNNGNYLGEKVIGTGSKDKIKFTFTAASETITVYLGVGGWSGNYGKLRFWKIQLEDGEFATPSVPHPDEVYDGIVSMDRDGLTVSMEDGEGIQGKAILSYNGFTVYDSDEKELANFGQDSTAFIGELNANNIYCDTVVKYDTNAPSTIYVSPSGSGDKSGMNINNKSNSINHALSEYKQRFGTHLHRKGLVIEVADGSYEENVDITGWSGSWSIAVKFGKGVILNGSISIQSNTVRVYINGQRSSNALNEGAIIKNIGATETISCLDGYVYIQNLRATANVDGKNFLSARNGARVSVTNVDVTNHYYFALSYDGSHVGLWNNRGKVTRRFACRFGSTIALDMAQPIDDGKSFKQEGSAILLDDVTPTDSIYNPSGTTPPISWQWFEKAFNLTNLKTTTEGTGSTTSSKNGEWGQGYWSPYKAHRGYATIPNDASSWCSGGRNFTVTLTMTRLNTSHGNNSDSPQPKLKQPSGTFWNSGVGFGRGATKTITLPSTIASAIASGSMKTLEMWADRVSSQYSFYNNTKITIKCEKQV